MIWGADQTVRITIGRADWWDRRNGRSWTDAMSYANIRRCLEANDEAGIYEIFPKEPPPAERRRTTVLPVGRVELTFRGFKLTEASLDMHAAEITLFANDAAGARRTLGVLDLSPEAPVLRLRVAPGIAEPEVRNVPAWETLGEHLSRKGFEPPQCRADGWTQTTPADAALTVRHGMASRDEWRMAVVLGDESADAALAASFENRAAWWEAYWRRVPRIDTPNAQWMFLYPYGMYKFAGFTAPQGVPATLQGPWIEDYQMPPWSSDYHFNINVQMCYSPGYQAGLFDHFKPLFAMIESWLPILRENARKFVGVEDGYLLPHAVNDRCEIIGGFWTGTIDHGCTAWVGKMMYDYVDYSGDEAFLRRLAFPFLKGALRVYEAMMERRPDGSLSFPVSVSPEYRATQMDAWGRDASFQLAACHWLVNALEDCAARLGETSDPAWREIREKLPLAALVGEPGREEIGLWENLVLEESHRHHSYLACIQPFDTLPTEEARWGMVARRSHDRWVKEGMGQWSGWSMPWAAMLQSRFGNPVMTELLLEIWERIFTNEGHGTLHDVASYGFSVMGGSLATGATRKEIMQMDAGMSATAAIMDSFAHLYRGVVRLFPGVSNRWKNCSFDGLHVGGGFVIGARREAGRVATVTVHANRDGGLKIANPWDANASPIELRMAAGETRELQAP